MSQDQSLYEILEKGNNRQSNFKQTGWHNLSDLWYSFAMRLSTAASNALKSNHDGVVKISVELYVDANGDPIYWLEPEVSRVEPSGKARDNIRRVIGI